ncbi:MAG: hypothetical protein ABR520_08530 [Mycobacteriales bacterium]
MRIRRPLIAVTAALLAVPAVALAAPKSNPAPKFAPPVTLSGFSGGEPSVAFDPSGNGWVYVDAPQSIPSVVDNQQRGVGLWASHDGARHFAPGINVGSYVGGGDSDVEVGIDHTVYIADLELIGSAICRSSDNAKTFESPGVPAPDSCDGAVADQQGPVADREWLTHGPKGELYLTYHDPHVELPYVYRSDDRAQTFVPCGSVFDPTGNALQNFTPGPTSGTQVPKPVVGPDGTLYVPVAAAAPVDSTVGFSSLYVEIAEGGCTPATATFVEHTIYQHSGADLANPFDGLAIDGGGVLYLVATGKTTADEKYPATWLFTSTDNGVHWGKPVKVSPPAQHTALLPAVAGGLRRGQVAVGWYGATEGGDLRYYVATSTDAGKHFSVSATTKAACHSGTGISRGVAGDFSSIAVEPRTGAVVAVYGADPSGKGVVWVNRQTGGRFLR